MWIIAKLSSCNDISSRVMSFGLSSELIIVIPGDPVWRFVCQDDYRVTVAVTLSENAVFYPFGITL